MLGDHDAHRAYEDYAVRHVMGGLDEAEQGAFRAHLLGCPECRARVGELRTIASDLAEVERAERRERAAKVVETKEREDDDAGQDDDPPAGRPRAHLAAIVGGILLIVVLSAWNFVLRGQHEQAREVALSYAAAAEALNFGEAWEVEAEQPAHRGIARVQDGSLAMMVRGTDDRALYEVALYDDDGEVLFSGREQSVDGLVRFYRQVPSAAVRVDLTLDRAGDGETVVFRAVAG